jgi:ubiquinone/menaquinone biosynthesis C-methylase UbiE
VGLSTAVSAELAMSDPLAARADGPKAYKGLAMEGFVARRYARLRRSGRQIEDWRTQAIELTSGLRDGASILEVAPGPGYFAIEMARIDGFLVTGLDISRTFVQIARDNARRAGASVTFRLGDASNMPFAVASFDLVVCQAAFKNFTRPEHAMNEMNRVLREGGTAVIQDMRRDAPDAAVREEVLAMRLGPLAAFMTRRILSGLRRRAYTKEQFEQMSARSAFGACEIATTGIGVDVRLKKRGTTI